MISKTINSMSETMIMVIIGVTRITLFVLNSSTVFLSSKHPTHVHSIVFVFEMRVIRIFTIISGVSVSWHIFITHRVTRWTWFLLVSSHHNISFIDDLIFSLSIFWRNRNGNSPFHRDFFEVRSWNWDSSGHRNSFKDGILHMINIILLIVFLNYGLSNNLLSRNIHYFFSGDLIDLSWFCNSIQLDSSIG